MAEADWGSQMILGNAANEGSGILYEAVSLMRGS